MKIGKKIKLDNALSPYRISFRAPLGTTICWSILGKSFLLQIELEHKTCGAIKTLNFNLKVKRSGFYNFTSLTN